MYHIPSFLISFMTLAPQATGWCISGLFFDHSFTLRTSKTPIYTSEGHFLYFSNFLMWYVIGQPFDHFFALCSSIPSSPICLPWNTFTILTTSCNTSLDDLFTTLYYYVHTYLDLTLRGASKLCPNPNVLHNWRALWPLFILCTSFHLLSLLESPFI